MDRILSVDNMTKVDIPSPRHGKIIFFCNLKFSFLRWRMVFFPDRKRRIHMAPTAWLKTVAIAAPLTPRSNTKIIQNNVDHRTDHSGHHTDLCKSLCGDKGIHSHYDQDKNASQYIDSCV